ncbi:hypothetical protein A3F08_03205 [Candidatus Berkelbacteria bacterium RIFCSPHIGHO2_12_FULL_36_9]|uniref:Uncharacterized protein n=1 Tax=Candidatus Berkelbacteria bacterium RIFCSPHIGHO2_12_FULL_36_9 TaxID=1797469 RepID=A0A1F5EKD1_9BACT|nr:MAG: hypothetical protein A3F08_03205 [Candidatus Berkelbacteria bacterium RIFCSPHIGHO2_12_FULL_36_9]
MRKLIHYSIYLLIAGTIISTLGMTGSISVKADVLKANSPALFQGGIAAVVIGACFIVLALIFFILAVSKSDK